MSRTVIVAGASRGIGLSVVQILLGSNTRVVTVSRSAGGLPDLEKQYKGNLHIIKGDVTDQSIVDESISAAVSKFGRLDGLVLNHGVVDPFGTIESLKLEEWKTNLDINLFSYIAFVKAALPELRKSQGRIVHVSSGAATSPYKGWGAYCVSKAAVNMLSGMIAAEEPTLTSIAIRPGVVDTDMQQQIRTGGRAHMGDERHDFFVTLHRQGKLLPPDVPGHVIAKLALDAPHNLSGKFLSWDSEELKEFQKK